MNFFSNILKGCLSLAVLEVRGADTPSPIPGDVCPRPRNAGKVFFLVPFVSSSPGLDKRVTGMHTFTLQVITLIIVDSNMIFPPKMSA